MIARNTGSNSLYTNTMLMDLPTFIQTVYQASSDPTSSLFLPVAILEQPQSIDPWSISSLNMGDLAAIDPSLPGKLCNAITGGSIASPASAVMQLTNVQISGLSNAVLSQPTVNGTSVSCNIVFGGATLPPGLSKQTSVQVSASFTINVSCCASSDGSTCSSSPQGQAITGTLQTVFQSAGMALVMNVASDYTTTANSIAFNAAGSTSSFTVTPPQSVAISVLLNTAFQSGPGLQAMLACINTAFTASSTLAGFGTTLTPILQTVANPTLIAWLAGQLSKAANDPSSSFYLPKQIKSTSNPVLDPYIVSGSWNLGDVSTYFAGAGDNICTSIGGTQGQNEICVPQSAVTLVLSDIVLTGISNAFAAPLLTVDNNIEALATFGQVTSWTPATLVINGSFVLTVSCCTTQDFQTCSGPPQQSVGTGTFSATITDSAVTANIAITASATQMQGTVSALKFLCDPNLISSTNVVFVINITSVPAGQTAVWDAQAEKLFNSPSATAAIIAQINAQMNEASVLSQISEIITNALNSLGAARLDEIIMEMQQNKKSKNKKTKI
jgi:hypothetical protein